jgi:hypothetical protein
MWKMKKCQGERKELKGKILLANKLRLIISQANNFGDGILRL